MVTMAVTSPLRCQGAQGVAPPAHRAGAPGAMYQNENIVYSPLGTGCGAPGAPRRRPRRNMMRPRRRRVAQGAGGDGGVKFYTE